MKLLVCGDRNWTDQRAIELAFDRLPEAPDVLIEGGASGADTLARRIARVRGWEIATAYADWKKYGKAAGPMRNRFMLEQLKPDLVLAFHADIEHSKGTKDMVRQATAAGVEVRIITGRTPTPGGA